MVAKIVHSETQEEYPIESFTLLGRSADSNIHIPDGSVSRQHASIRTQGNAYWITDLGSSNGTRINKLLVTSAQKLAHGDQIQLGNVLFQFFAPETASGTDDDPTMFQTQVLQTTESPVETAQATLLVADIKGFTSLSEKIGAEQLARIIDQWYSTCRTILTAREGTIDKFIGDCVFAYWRSTTTSSRSLALEAAHLLAGKEGQPKDANLAVLAEHDIEFDCRVGLHQGEIALSGGSLTDYTALGDTVNVTFRIEAMTRDLDKKILTSADFAQDWNPHPYQLHSLGNHPLKGVEQEVEIYESPSQ